MDDLSSTTGIVALAAAGGALASLVLAVVLAFRVRIMRRAQTAVLGEHDSADLVDHVHRLELRFAELTDYVNDAAERLDGRMSDGERRLDGAVSHVAVVRYDAYNEMSGHQSTSIALLDDRRTGVVLSSIHHRDQARLYAKQITAGEAEIALSPEEEQAIEAAISGGAGAVPAVGPERG